MRIFPLLHRLFWLYAAAGLASMSAQQTVSFTVSTEPSGASFTVDGAIYRFTTQFQWPAGSKHIVGYLQTQLPDGSILPGNPDGTFTPLQLTQNGTELYMFQGWQDSTGFLGPSQDVNQVVTADGSITFLTAKVTLSYRVLLSFLSSGATAAPSCGAPGETPPSAFLVGYVYINSLCYWNSAMLYYPAGSTLTLNAFPLPGFVFMGWSSNLGSNSAYLRSYVLKGPVEIAPQFGPGKRVRVVTKPLGLSVLIDRTQAPTLNLYIGGNACPLGEKLPIPVATYDVPLCFGDFDFAPGSNHLIAAPSPEKDIDGKLWIFDSWTSTSGQSGTMQNTVYATDSQTSHSDQIIVAFDPGVQASFVTVPAGLKLKVDGRDNWAAYNFVWALGSTHQVTAPAQQTDAAGRQYTLSGWSNGASASQTVTMDPATLTGGFRILATYNELSRLVVQTGPAGQTVQIDGVSCVTPCNVDRPSGTQVHITAATSIPLAEGVRLNFSSWSDIGAADRTYVITANLQTLTASYSTFYRLSTSADPANGVNFALNPASPDGFYPADTQVTINAEARSGFRFRRWGGDLSGTYPSGTLLMSGGPHSLTALLDRIPYVAPTGVENGVGPTPDAVVAPGSIAMIRGESLAPDTVVGPVNPLAQTIDNVTVTLGNRLLPMFSVTPQQITVLLPSDLTAGNYTLQVHSAGQPDASGDFTVARNAPGIFTYPTNSKPYILALHADGSLVTIAKPAVQGEQITFFGTGFGPYSAPLVDGFFPPNPPPAIKDPVVVIAAGQTLQPDWTGAAAGYIGLVALHFTITSALPAATEVELQVQVNGRFSNTVVVPLQ